MDLSFNTKKAFQYHQKTAPPDSQWISKTHPCIHFQQTFCWILKKEKKKKDHHYAVTLNILSVKALSIWDIRLYNKIIYLNQTELPED